MHWCNDAMKMSKTDWLEKAVFNKKTNSSPQAEEEQQPTLADVFFFFFTHLTPPPGDNTQLQQVDMGHIKSWNKKVCDGFVCEKFYNKDCWDIDQAVGCAKQRSWSWNEPRVQSVN